MLVKEDVEAIWKHIKRTKNSASRTGDKDILVPSRLEAEEINKESWFSGSRAVCMLDLVEEKIDKQKPLIISNEVVDQLCESFLVLEELYNDLYSKMSSSLTVGVDNVE